jgi:drug/metabolite transporter (DMT)-like permease
MYRPGTKTSTSSKTGPVHVVVAEEEFGSSQGLATTSMGTSTTAEDFFAAASSASSAPSPMVVNTSLIVAQIFFGLGSVIAALGLPACNPFAFALYREIAAGLILLLAASIVSQQQNTTKSTSTKDTTALVVTGSGVVQLLLTPLLVQLPRFLLLGLAIYANQAGAIAGIKLAGPITAAIWQPSQPIMTAAICMAFRWEPINGRRVVGVVLAFGGCVLMVLLHHNHPPSNTTDDTNIMAEDTAVSTATTNKNPFSFLVGNVLFFINCLGTSLYVILSKKVLRLYPPLLVTAWSYNIAALFMALTAVVASASPSFMTFLCPDCTSTWHIPSGAFFALGYFIVFNSVAAYAIMTWANQYATGTLVMGFTVLQPVTAALLTLVLLGLGSVPSCSALDHPEATDEAGEIQDGRSACLDPPGWSSICGMVGVFAGLFLVIATEPKTTRDEEYSAVTQNDELPTDHGS